jgi:(2R)-ethylmalonyl-CoA mutase
MWDEHRPHALGTIADEEESCGDFRNGVQVNSLGLTEQQPENNVYRILLEMLAVTLVKDARARAVQLPAWNEALGLPRPWDQQWSIRLQQDRGRVRSRLCRSSTTSSPARPSSPPRVAEMCVPAAKGGAWHASIALGGAVPAVRVRATWKEHFRLVEPNARRIAAIEAGEQVVVGVEQITRTRRHVAAHHRWRRRFPHGR